MPRKPSTKPRATIRRLPDRHKRKRAPNGVRSVLLAIQYYWHSLSTNKAEDEHLTPAAFCAAGFEKVFDTTFERYPAMWKKPEKLNRLLHHLTNGDHNIEFAHLLAFSEYVQVPLSVLLLFTQMVSDESRALDGTTDFRAHALRTLRRIRFVIQTAEHEIAECSPDQRIFLHEYDEFEEPGHMLAKARALKSWSQAYNSAEALDFAEQAVTLMHHNDRSKA